MLSLLLLGVARPALGLTYAKDATLAATPGEPIDVKFDGFDDAGKALTYRLKSLPATGALRLPAQVYCDYRYLPKHTGTAAVAGATLGCESVHAIYTYPPTLRPPFGRMDTFQFVASSDGGVTFPYQATIHVVPSTASTMLTSADFSTGTESFLASDSKGVWATTYEPTSIGAEMNRYVHASDRDRGNWWFLFPSAFLGDQAMAYGGSLSFALSSAAGDFSASKLRAKSVGSRLAGGVWGVMLDCATCSNGAGITLGFPVESLGFTGATKRFTVPLSEASWRKDPHNTLNTAWSAPTKCELVEVLSKLSAVRVLGDFTTGPESVSLDKVRLAAGTGKHNACEASRIRSA